jgi:hypothetical protein
MLEKNMAVAKNSFDILHENLSALDTTYSLKIVYYAQFV